MALCYNISLWLYSKIYPYGLILPLLSDLVVTHPLEKTLHIDHKMVSAPQGMPTGMYCRLCTCEKLVLHVASQKISYCRREKIGQTFQKSAKDH